MAGSEENQSPSFKILLIIKIFRNPFHPGPYFFPAPLDHRRRVDASLADLPLPGLTMFRSYARFGLLAYLALALLAAGGLTLLHTRSPGDLGSRPWPSCC